MDEDDEPSDGAGGVEDENTASEEEWRFGVDDVGEDAEPAVDPIEPGAPGIENVAFFVLGAVAMVSALVLLLFG